MAENYPILRDYFSRINTDGWSSLDSGQNWKLSQDNSSLASGYPRFKADADTNSGYLTMTTSDSTQYNHAVYADGPYLTNTEDILIKFKVTSTTYGFGVVFGRANHNSWYTVCVRNGNEILILVKDSNVTSGTPYPNLVIVAQTGITYSANTWYWLRGKRTATQIQGKIWQLGTAEPASAQVVSGFYGGVQKPSTGNAGIWFKGGATNGTIYVDTFLGYHGAGQFQPDTDVSTTFSTSKWRGIGDTPTDHNWNGDFGESPLPYDNNANTAVSPVYAQYDPSQSNFKISFNTGTIARPYVSTIGRDYANTEVLSSLVFNNTNQFFANLHNQLATTSAGRFTRTGYYAEISSGSNLITLSAGTTETQTLPFTVAQGVRYSIRTQQHGGRIYYKVWPTASTEPILWQGKSVNVGSPANGQSGFSVQGAATTSLNIYSFSSTTTLSPPSLGSDVIIGANSSVTSSAIRRQSSALTAEITSNTTFNPKKYVLSTASIAAQSANTFTPRTRKPSAFSTSATSSTIFGVQRRRNSAMNLVSIVSAESFSYLRVRKSTVDNNISSGFFASAMSTPSVQLFANATSNAAFAGVRTRKSIFTTTANGAVSVVPKKRVKDVFIGSSNTLIFANMPGVYSSLFTTVMASDFSLTNNNLPTYIATRKEIRDQSGAVPSPLYLETPITTAYGDGWSIAEGGNFYATNSGGYISVTQGTVISKARNTSTNYYMPIILARNSPYEDITIAIDYNTSYVGLYKTSVAMAVEQKPEIAAMNLGVPHTWALSWSNGIYHAYLDGSLLISATIPNLSLINAAFTRQYAYVSTEAYGLLLYSEPLDAEEIRYLSTKSWEWSKLYSVGPRAKLVGATSPLANATLQAEAQVIGRHVGYMAAAATTNATFAPLAKKRDRMVTQILGTTVYKGVRVKKGAVAIKGQSAIEIKLTDFQQFYEGAMRRRSGYINQAVSETFRERNTVEYKHTNPSMFPLLQDANLFISANVSRNKSNEDVVVTEPYPRRQSGNFFIENATENYLLNPHFQNGTGGLSYVDKSPLATAVRDTNMLPQGALASIHCTLTGTDTYESVGLLWVGSALAGSSKYVTGQAMVRGSGTIRFIVRAFVNGYTSARDYISPPITLTSEWQTLQGTVLTQPSDTVINQIHVIVADNWNGVPTGNSSEFWMACPQAEYRHYATSFTPKYINGVLSSGQGWSGTPHNSVSYRLGNHPSVTINPNFAVKGSMFARVKTRDNARTDANIPTIFYASGDHGDGLMFRQDSASMYTLYSQKGGVYVGIGGGGYPTSGWITLYAEWDGTHFAVMNYNGTMANGTRHTPPTATSNNLLGIGARTTQNDRQWNDEYATAIFFDEPLAEEDRETVLESLNWTYDSFITQKMPFLVDNTNDIPIGYGTALTRWGQGTTVIETYRNIPEDILYRFGRLSVTEDEYATSN